MATKNYSNEDITVKWQSDLCIHSEKCFHGLKSVFNPNQRPWIQLEASNTETIVKQIDQCPSGALSYTLKNMEDQKTISSATVIETMPNGPLLVRGSISVKHDGTEDKKDAKVTAFCRCGGSENKPYCDGTHKKIDFQG